MKGFHPFSLFDSQEQLESATRYCLVNHILSCHEYHSLYMRRVWAELYDEKQIKSVFDDTFTAETIKQHIVSTILDPTYMVRQDFYKPHRYAVMKR